MESQSFFLKMTQKASEKKSDVHETHLMNFYKDPLFVGMNESSSQGTIIFNGNNFANWSRSVKTALGAKNKQGILDESCKKPDGADYMVRSWILASIKPEIAESVVFVDSSKQLWEKIMEKYGQTNAPQLFHLKNELNNLQQNELSVSEYYCKLKALWDQISNLEGIPTCECGVLESC